MIFKKKKNKITIANLWLACDGDDKLVLFKDKPFRDNWYRRWSKWESGVSYNYNDEITVREHDRNRFVVPRSGTGLSWHDEPLRVKLIIEN